ncbi:uncharacterized protein LOC129741702 [Uranotaenia lowii]|uniref:uncharacterized protein LOC129741702 n=1 Tax=Uranotaenia lowii TaxID=190385 RepID=UPI0024786405|nr:uncharacterized protein LOC129741702 [Uranotaenia lowii]
MEPKKLRITNQLQFAELVRRMELNPSVAKGLKYAEATNVSRQNFHVIWADTTEALNSLGPPTRTAAEWQKVWADFKLKTKSKLLKNKKDLNATGGGPNNSTPLTACEEAVVGLLSLEKAVCHGGTVFGLTEGACLDEEASMEVESDQPILDTPQAASTPSSSKKQVPKEAVELLRLQVGCLEGIKESAEQICRYSRKTFYLKEEQLKLQQKHIKRKHEHMLRIEQHKKEKLELKMEMLRYKKEKLDFLKQKSMQD